MFYLPMELYYLCIDFVFQFIVEKYRNKLNQIKLNQIIAHSDITWHWTNTQKSYKIEKFWALFHVL